MSHNTQCFPAAAPASTQRPAARESEDTPTPSPPNMLRTQRGERTMPGLSAGLVQI